MPLEIITESYNKTLELSFLYSCYKKNEEGYHYEWIKKKIKVVVLFSAMLRACIWDGDPIVLHAELALKL